ANEINATRRHEFDEKELNAVQRENQKLDRWKNQFLPSGGERGEGGIEGNGSGGKIIRERTRTKYGEVPAAIDIEHANGTLKVGKGVALPDRKSTRLNSSHEWIS